MVMSFLSVVVGVVSGVPRRHRLPNGRVRASRHVDSVAGIKAAGGVSWP